MYESLATKDPRVKTSSERSESPLWMAVWLDQNDARILKFAEDEVMEQTSFESGMKFKHKATGGTHASVPYAATHSMSSEKNEQSWRREIRKKFFKQIMNEVRDADRILVLGPGTTKNELWRELADLKHFANSLEPDPLAVGDMSEGQLTEIIKGYFGAPSPRYLP